MIVFSAFNTLQQSIKLLRNEWETSTKNIKSKYFVNKYNYKGIHYPSGKDD